MKILEVWLTVRVHIDAFRFAPRAYLTAAKWWIRRRRMRARGQFAPLLSYSPKSYALWVVRQARDHHRSPPADPPVIALVDACHDANASTIAATRASLAAEHIDMLLVGSTETPTLASAGVRIDWSKSPWLLLMRAGDRILPGTAAAYRAAMREGGQGLHNEGNRRLIYADDDLLVGGKRRHPYFKPDWNPELFCHHDYLSGACLLQANQADLLAMADGVDWIERLTAKLAGESTPVHLPLMLHHRQRRTAPRLPVAPLDRPSALPLLSVIVPTRNRVDLLRTCLDGLAATDYPDMEVIIVDNDSDEPETLAYLEGLEKTQGPRRRLLHHPGPFNYSAINNRAIATARGRLLCLLNNDIEVIESRWLSIMAMQALRPDVGAVGARLLYPDGRIQHAGVVIGVGHAAGHAHRFLHPAVEGYFHRHSLPQFTSAVTAACLVVERDKFLAVGGLNERDFPVAFNDVDLCLRLNSRGWQSLYEPRATLIHHESVSRGLDQDPVGAARYAGELAALQRLWMTDLVTDPYHHPALSRASEQFAVSI